MPIFLIPMLLSLGACSLQKMALRGATPVFQKSSDGLMQESNLNFFESSAPANIKMAELLWMQDRENLDLLAVVIKGYAGYAYAIAETKNLADELSGEEMSPSKKEAIDFYTRALDYGLLYLKKKGIKKELLLTNDDQKLQVALKSLDEDDLSALLYTAQAWGSLINLQKSNMALISQVPKVKVLFDRVCEIRPDVDQGVCDIFYAQYEASRPRMLGGNPEKGEKLFLEAIRKYPQNLLIRLSYVQFVIVPAMDGEKYEAEAKVLREEFAKWDDKNRDGLETVSPYKEAASLNLYNAVAQKRFSIIEGLKKKIF